MRKQTLSDEERKLPWEGINVELINKRERSPCVEDNRTTKKVKIRDQGEATSDMETEELVANAEEDQKRTDVKRQLHYEDDLDIEETAANDEPVASEPGRLEVECHEMRPSDQAPPSFTDKLMGEQRMDKGGDKSTTEELTIEHGDILVNLDGQGGCFMIKFEEEEDYLNALLGGPWVVQGHYLTVHPWEPTISPQNL